MKEAVETTTLPVHGIEDLYRFYVSEQKRRNEPYVGYFQYTETLRRFNAKVISEVLNGKTFTMGFELGRICIARLKRDFSRPTIDWGETKKLQKQGVNQWVYFQDTHYYRWFWKKLECRVPNKSVYCFAPSKGPGGSVKKLASRLKSDEFAFQSYKTKEELGYPRVG
jgi:hypothetical protein